MFYTLSRKPPHEIGADVASTERAPERVGPERTGGERTGGEPAGRGRAGPGGGGAAGAGRRAPQGDAAPPAHTHQPPETRAAADHVGDSLALSRLAAAS